MVDKQTNNSGFALLVSLIVVSVVLSVGLVILDLTIKQVRLGVTTKDSEVSFHAANAGMECARYWRRERSDRMINGNTAFNIACFGQAATDISATPAGSGNVSPESVTLTTGGNTAAYQYEYQFTWGPGNDRCTRINTVSIVAPLSGGAVDAVVALSEMRNRIPGYPGSADVTCVAGSQCTIVAVRGYNQACPAAGDTFGFGVVERQVLLEF